jgi:hypothetical protein
MAVPVMRGKASPTMASVVGKTGAMEIPAQKHQDSGQERGVTGFAASEYVVTVIMNSDAAMRDEWARARLIRMRRDRHAADQQAERKTER